MMISRADSAEEHTQAASGCLQLVIIEDALTHRLFIVQYMVLWRAGGWQRRRQYLGASQWTGRRQGEAFLNIWPQVSDKRPAGLFLLHPQKRLSSRRLVS